MRHRIVQHDLRVFMPNADLLDLPAAPHVWNVNSISVGTLSTEIHGWSLPHGGRLGNNGLEINGTIFPVEQSEKAAGGYAELYPWYPNAAMSGFVVKVPHSKLDVPSCGEMELRSVPLGGANGSPGYALNILIEDLDYQIPEPVIAARIGVGEPLHYTMFGRSIYRGFDRMLSSVNGAGFSAAERIVDWGCGSGRVARHIVRGLKSDQSLRGFDIDATAIRWSNENIGRHFEASGLEPPLGLGKGTVDVVVAYSVFTHLSEQSFVTWIAELSRVLRPGGTLLMTVLGDFAMAALAPNFPRSAHESWRARGIYDDSGNRQLETIGVTGDTYRNTWVKRRFVEKAIAGHFSLVAYQSPFHFYQDLVVLRRK